MTSIQRIDGATIANMPMIQDRTRRSIAPHEFAGKWIAEDRFGKVIESAGTLAALRQALLGMGYSRGRLPAVKLVPPAVEGFSTF